MNTVRRSRRRVGVFALGTLAFSVLVGCSNDGQELRTASGSQCFAGPQSPSESVHGLLTAVQNGSQESAKTYLYASPEISEGMWAELAGQLEGVAIDGLKLAEESEFAEVVTVEVTHEDGSLLETFQVYYSDYDLDLECAAVYWGTYPEGPDAEASQPATL